MNAQLEGFYQKLYADPALQSQVMAGANGDIEKILGNAVSIGAGMGYRFSLDEAREFGANLEELPDDMLDLVSAGAGANCNDQSSGNG